MVVQVPDLLKSCFYISRRRKIENSGPCFLPAFLGGSMGPPARASGLRHGCIIYIMHVVVSAAETSLVRMEISQQGELL